MYNDGCHCGSLLVDDILQKALVLYKILFYPIHSSLYFQLEEDVIILWCSLTTENVNKIHVVYINLI